MNQSVICLGSGQVLLRAEATLLVWRLAKSGADQASHRDGIRLPPQVVELLAALRSEVDQLTNSSASSANGFRESVSQATSSSVGDEVSTQEAAVVLNCSERWARAQARALGARKVAGRWRFSRAALVATVEAGE